MPASELKQRWRNGEVTYGAGCKLGSTWTAEVLAVLGFDFVKIDLEHGLNWETPLTPLFQAMKGTNTTPLVKLPEVDPVMIGRVLDAGAEGVRIAHMSTAEEAAEAVAACRHAPNGGTRSNSAFRLRYLPGGMLRETICIATIEDLAGAKNAPAIAAVDGIDAITIGAGDLALDLGLPPLKGHEIQSGIHEETILGIQKACKDNGIPCGMTSDGGGRELKDRGFQIISLGDDSSFFERGVKAALDSR